MKLSNGIRYWTPFWEFGKQCMRERKKCWLDTNDELKIKWKKIEFIFVFDFQSSGRWMPGIGWRNIGNILLKAKDQMSYAVVHENIKYLWWRIVNARAFKSVFHLFYIFPLKYESWESNGASWKMISRKLNDNWV